MNGDIAISLIQPKDFTKALGGFVRALRLRARLTQPELASRAGVPASTISRLERTGLASTDRLARVLFALNSLDDLHAFVEERRHVADLPSDLSSFHVDARRPTRIRHRKNEGKSK